ncbi:MAG: ABC transporter permease [Lentimicrobiaceae bacterium]|nr:ABC transporter permease [Lentimicrobiaceae bacterium]
MEKLFYLYRSIPITMTRRFFLFLRMFRESYLFALQSILVNKVRTILSLLGITIGIFSIISVFTVFDSIEITIHKSIESLGSNILFVQKWPWAFGDANYAWWKYMKRPEASLEDLEAIQKYSQASQASAYMVGVNRTVKFQNNSIEDAPVTAVSHDYQIAMPINLSDGRYFTYNESVTGKPVAIIGSDVAANLLNNQPALGKKITVFGQKVEVVGIFEKEGDNMFDNSNDNQVMIPVQWIRNFVDLRGDNIESTIIVRAKPLVSNEELTDELTGIMRQVRKLKPGTEDDFAINETSIITKGFESLFRVIAVVGWIIGGFSLLVGGFGIANIMFVSVKERTGIIGIQKSLGAKRYFILLEFLFEAVFLSVFGGLIGLTIIYIGTLVISALFDMELILTQSNILIGVGVSAGIGLISGLFPAFSASRLDPVEAMRSTF